MPSAFKRNSFKTDPKGAQKESTRGREQCGRIMYPFVSPAFGVPVDYVAVRAIFALPYLALPFPTAGRKRTKRAQTANIRSFLRATAISVGEPCRSHTLPWFFCVTYFTHRSCGFLEAALYSNFGWRFFGALYLRHDDGLLSLLKSLFHRVHREGQSLGRHFLSFSEDLWRIAPCK